MAGEQHDDILAKWLRGEVTDGELQEVASPEEVLKYRQILNEVDRWVPDNDPVVFDPALVTRRRKETKTRQLNWWIPISIAASIAFLITIGVFFFGQTEEVHYLTASGETLEILLPDGSSKVTLASESEISWMSGQWTEDHREMTLSGKAYFEVEKGGAFIVNIPQGKVEVLGTRFEVDEFEQSLQVTCFEGKVKAFANDEEKIVQAGESYLYYNSKWEESAEPDGELPSWMQDRSVFTNAPLEQVINALSAQYNLEIDPGSVNIQRRFTGAFPNDNLGLALKIVFDPLGISYDLSGNQLFLSE